MEGAASPSSVAIRLDDDLDLGRGVMLVAPDDGPEPCHERVRLRLAEPIFADAYRVNRATGAALLIDEGTNATVGAVLVTADGDDWP